MRKPSAVRFFFSHAGYSWNHLTETPRDGRWRCARDLTRAEAYAHANDWTFEWTDDWSIGSHVREFGAESYPEEPSTCECCVLRDSDGRVLSSLCCIDDASAEYRRVVQAELATEALANTEATLEREASSAGDVPDVR